MTETNIFDLPIEIRREILSFTNPIDCVNFSKTCAKFRPLSNDLNLIYPHLLPYLKTKENLIEPLILLRISAQEKAKKIKEMVNIIIPNLVKKIILNYPGAMFKLNFETNYSFDISMNIINNYISYYQQVMIYNRETRKAISKSFRNNLIKVHIVSFISQGRGSEVSIRICNN